ncbi:MAG TPA: hypothetical protein VGS10_16955 [Terracidiphilus sp.]|nr:hypothetical protein [Terracidiphilus sp.]
MSTAVYPQPQLGPLQPGRDRAILITGSRAGKVAEDLREEIRDSGWDCEILDVSDRSQVRKMVHDVLDCFQSAGVPVDDTGTIRACLIQKMTDEEWLAQ